MSVGCLMINLLCLYKHAPLTSVWNLKKFICSFAVSEKNVPCNCFPDLVSARDLIYKIYDKTHEINLFLSRPTFEE